MGLISALKRIRHKLRAASLFGSASRAAASGDVDEAYALTRHTLAILKSTGIDSADTAAIHIESVILLDQVSARLMKPPPQEQLQEALKSASRFAGQSEIDKRIEWLRSRLTQLNGDQS